MSANENNPQSHCDENVMGSKKITQREKGRNVVAMIGTIPLESLASICWDDRLLIGAQKLLQARDLIRSDLELRRTVICLGFSAQSATLQLAHGIPLMFDHLHQLFESVAKLCSPLFSPLSCKLLLVQLVVAHCQETLFGLDVLAKLSLLRGVPFRLAHRTSIPSHRELNFQMTKLLLL